MGATPIDFDLLRVFDSVFVVLFVFVLFYAILTYVVKLTENKGINSLIAFSVAILFISSGTILNILKNTVPWYVLIAILLVMISLAIRSIGAEIPTSLMNNIGWYILIAGVLIFVINVSLELGQDAGPFLDGENEQASSSERKTTNSNESIEPGSVGTGDFTSNFGATLFHPKVLALSLVLVIGFLAVMLLGSS